MTPPEAARLWRAVPWGNTGRSGKLLVILLLLTSLPFPAATAWHRANVPGPTLPPHREYTIGWVNRQAAPDFLATDEASRPVSLGRFRDRVVVLALLGPADPMRAAVAQLAGRLHQKLGADAASTAFVALGAGPEAPGEATGSSSAYAGMVWSYLDGSAEAVEELRARYRAAARGQRPSDSAELYLIDRFGHLRTYITVRQHALDSPQVADALSSELRRWIGPGGG